MFLFLDSDIHAWLLVFLVIEMQPELGKIVNIFPPKFERNNELLNSSIGHLKMSFSVLLF